MCIGNTREQCAGRSCATFQSLWLRGSTPKRPLSSPVRDKMVRQIDDITNIMSGSERTEFHLGSSASPRNAQTARIAWSHEVDALCHKHETWYARRGAWLSASCLPPPPRLAYPCVRSHSLLISRILAGIYVWTKCASPSLEMRPASRRLHLLTVFECRRGPTSSPSSPLHSRPRRPGDLF